MKSGHLKSIVLTFVALCFASCSATGSLNVSASTDITNALAIGCPIVSAIQASNIALNSVQRSALGTLALACPPNPPPTSEAVAVADLVSAYTILQPLMK